jgi:hypothetical protein
MRCRLLDLQQRVERDGRTRLLLVIAPDKSTAYADYLPAESRLPNAIERLAQIRGLPLPRLDLVMKQAIQQGAVDVYLPNDTHWGTAGSKLAAGAVIRYLDEHATMRKSTAGRRPD